MKVLEYTIKREAYSYSIKGEMAMKFKKKKTTHSWFACRCWLSAYLSNCQAADTKLNGSDWSFTRWQSSHDKWKIKMLPATLRTALVQTGWLKT